jgi:hypothetical protein
VEDEAKMISDNVFDVLCDPYHAGIEEEEASAPEEIKSIRSTLQNSKIGRRYLQWDDLEKI